MRLQSVLRDKAKQAEEAERLSTQFEEKLEKLRQEHQSLIDKVSEK